jgi:1,4-dihydroxy-2-naphthoate octaprenyltransferase
VLIGDRTSRVLFSVVLLVPFLILVVFVLEYENAYYAYAALLLALPAVLITLTAKTPGELILALKLTSFTGLVYGLVLAWAIAF